MIVSNIGRLFDSASKMAKASGHSQKIVLENGVIISVTPKMKFYDFFELLPAIYQKEFSEREELLDHI